MPWAAPVTIAALPARSMGLLGEIGKRGRDPLACPLVFQNATDGQRCDPFVTSVAAGGRPRLWNAPPQLPLGLARDGTEAARALGPVPVGGLRLLARELLIGAPRRACELHRRPRRR